MIAGFPQPDFTLAAVERSFNLDRIPPGGEEKRPRGAQEGSRRFQNRSQANLGNLSM